MTGVPDTMLAPQKSWRRDFSVRPISSNQAQVCQMSAATTHRWSFSICLAGLSLLASADLPADVVKLTDGGEIRGLVKSPAGKPRKGQDAELDEVVVESLTGAEIAVAEWNTSRSSPNGLAPSRNTSRLLAESPTRSSPAGNSPNGAGSTGFPDRKEQLQRILGLDTEHKPAHYGLGHRRQGNKWTTPEEADAELLAAACTTRAHRHDARTRSAGIEHDATARAK